jgi:hypothetical protein
MSTTPEPKEYLPTLLGHLGIDVLGFYDTLAEICIRTSLVPEEALELMGKEISGTWTKDNIKQINNDHYVRSRAEKRCWLTDLERCHKRYPTPLDRVNPTYPNTVNKTDVCSLDPPKTWMFKYPPSNYILNPHAMPRFMTIYSLLLTNNMKSMEIPLSLDIYTNEPRSLEHESRLHAELNGLSCEINKLRAKSQQQQSQNNINPYRSKYFQQDSQAIDQLRVCSRYEWPSYFVKGRTAIWKQLLKSQVIAWELSALANIFHRLVTKGFVQGADGDNNNADTFTITKIWDTEAVGNDLRNEAIKQYHEQLIKEIVREQSFLIDDMEEVTIPLTYEEVHYYAIEYMDIVLLYWNQREVHNQELIQGEDALQSLNRVRVLKRVLDLARPVDAMTWYEQWKLKLINLKVELPNERYVRQFITETFEQYKALGVDERNRVTLSRDEDVLCAYRYILRAKEIQMYHNLSTGDYMRERTESLLINVLLANFVDEDTYDADVKSGSFKELRAGLNATAYSAVASLIAFAHPIRWRHLDDILLNRDRLNERLVSSLNERSDFRDVPYKTDLVTVEIAKEKIDTIIQSFKDYWGDVIADPSPLSTLLDVLNQSPMGIVLSSDPLEGRMDRYRINLGLSRGDSRTTLCGEYMSNPYNNAPSMRSQQDSALYDMEVLQRSFGRLVLSQQYIEERERRKMSRALRLNRHDSRARYIKIITEVDSGRFPLKDEERMTYTCIWKVRYPRVSKTDIEEEEMNTSTQVMTDESDPSIIKRLCFVLDMPIITNTLGTVEIESQIKATYIDDSGAELVHNPVTSVVSVGMVTVEIFGTCTRCSKEHTTPSSYLDLVRGEAAGSEAIESDWKERVCEWEVPLYMIEKYKAELEGRTPTFDHIKRDSTLTYRGRHSDYSILPDLYGLSVGDDAVFIDYNLIKKLDNQTIGLMRLIRGSQRLNSFFDADGFDAEIRRLFVAMKRAVVGLPPTDKSGQNERLELVTYMRNINSNIILSGIIKTPF